MSSNRYVDRNGVASKIISMDEAWFRYSPMRNNPTYSNAKSLLEMDEGELLIYLRNPLRGAKIKEDAED